MTIKKRTHSNISDHEEDLVSNNHKKILSANTNNINNDRRGTSDVISENLEVEEEEDLAEENNLLSSSNFEWQRTISKVVKSVVSIHFSQVAPFDCDQALVSEATGFIVDADRGIILTNRHVVGSGPFVGFAVFDNHEECDLIPIYRDPVHDFGFLKFDPKKIEYMEVSALELKPSLASIGLEIRVVGNDAGEKLSILSGFISRLDRNAPDYGELTYNDFNTEYIQAAASASGGSSGSPVVNKDGYVVALQAGGSTEASTDFFLPLDRIYRALACIQENKPITRGTIQTQWLLKAFDECKRLGLTSDRESEFRSTFPDKFGLLVAETILKEGPASNKIEEGDVLISINNNLISSFIQVDDILDSSIGENIRVVVQRGGKEINFECKVGDLHQITPNKYVEVCGATFHELSYQMARLYAIPVRGVFLSSATGSFNLDKSEKVGWIIDSVDNKTTKDLAGFVEVMKKIPDRKRVMVTYHHLGDQHSPQVSSVYIDRHWSHEFRIYTRNDTTGIWDYAKLGEPIKPEPLVPKSAKFIDMELDSPQLSKVSHSLVMVSSIAAIPIDSISSDPVRLAGLILDAVNGYVVVSRRVIPHDCLDCFVTIAESIIVPASVIFLHPTQNFAIVKYNPKLVNANIESPIFSDRPLERNDKVTFIGQTSNGRLVSSPTKVSYISSFSVPSNLIPRYKATNLEAISIDCNISSRCYSGILCDEDDGKIRGLWLSFLGDRREDKENIYLMGLDITDILPVLNILRKNEKPYVHIVDAGFGSITPLQARIRGVPDEWIERMEQSSTTRIQFISVDRVSYTKEIKNRLYPGDVILAVNDKLVQSMRAVYGIVNTIPDKEITLKFKIVRNSTVVELPIKTIQVQETDSIVIFSGALVQEPHHAVLQAMTNLPSRVYVTFKSQASPATQYGISCTNFITHVNEMPTTNLQSFIKAIKTIPDNTYCKIRLVTFDNIPFAISLKTNYHYFPTTQLKKTLDTKEWVEETEAAE
ncbi:probable Pro-apoptotic serine protease NMA111 [Saccharomycodes ludwigii]|uniref:Pro-apoptotic serine protease NMA111 n=1 Tax=Saccharomycodes ludwigii TaxID=36035 RepID=A0A376BAJ2_9ASCO|nr:hypothetical protein SCDLUD_002884 [Saccharomycodes ludwigii]KAH3901392.1 hypothetical protein SCDLUD_002884 [Saccharomycodes ludwigii]SSD61564.1 probable Pro-apoptotic serine protease NMA111 [Saccharomycodes ludwigii]